MSDTPGTIRFLITDDHPIFRHGLRALLESEPDFKVVGEAADGLEAIEMAPRLRPDVLVVDLAMPRLGGMDTLAELAGAQLSGDWRPRVVVLTVAIGKKEIVEALQLGARGIVLKDSAAQVLIQALRTVLSGLYWVGREPITDPMQYLRRLAPARVMQEDASLLTPREREILSAIVGGLTNREIAAKLSIREDTVKHHLSSIFGKVGVSNRLELAMFAVNHGLLETE